MIIRHKGRDYAVATFTVEHRGRKLHDLQVIVSAKGRSVRVYLDGRELK